MIKYVLLGLILIPNLLFGQLKIVDHAAKGDDTFPISTAKQTATIVYDTTDFKVVEKTSHLLAADIKMITGKQAVVSTSDKKTKGPLIIVGTIGKSAIIDQLIEDNKLDVTDIANQWERYTVRTINKPMRGVPTAIVIAGSDKRGTAFGILSLSEAMGVSPWYYWADVPVQKSTELYLEAITYTSKAPTVKYRGIFLNDEDWGLHPWAAKNMDPTLEDIGPNTYEKVFELLLRLKANMVAPAMHECTKAFYTVPGNMEMAEAYGIMITTSHCEPLLYNNASEWDKKTQGEWNYVSNKKEIVKALDQRVQQAHENDNIYTIALRGMHDEGMKGGSEDKKLETLAEAIKDQREILAKHIDRPIEDIPQIFVPYKEVLNLYEKGLDLPEEITIVWPDDNYGYIKKMSNTEEQKRKGGAGVYYHLSYLGWPNDYLWLNTTPPALMYTEMHKAYSLGADTYWLVNVGDIKPGEMGMQLFLDMAWDFDQFNFDNINDYEISKMASIFGQEYEEDLAYIMNRYYHHGFTRKPEYMTWDWRWNSLFAEENVKDTEFSFINYNEAENRLSEYAKISNMAESILNKLSEEKKAAFYELVYYPVKGASLYNHEMLTGQKNRWYATQHRALTNSLANDVEMYHDSLALITKEYNNLLDGKWNGMMTAPGFLPKIQMSPTKQIELRTEAKMGLFVEGQNAQTTAQVLPEFNSAAMTSHYFEVYNKGQKPLQWEATTSQEWIKVSTTNDLTKTQTRVNVQIDWNKFPSEVTANGEIIITAANESQTVQVLATRSPKHPTPIFVENNGAISIAPTAYHRKHENKNIVFQTIAGLGYSDAALQLGNAQYNDGAKSHVEYDFLTTDTGEITIHTYMLPLFAKDKAHSTKYGIQIDDNTMIEHHNYVKEYSGEWAKNITRNSAIDTTKVTIDKAGKHTLKLYCIDPGMIIQKVVIYTDDVKKSYLGPEVQGQIYK